ncbi:tRNA (N6-isopentenyl adenosine(37)-C2)-methylthiotransferase MiaB [Desulfobacter hydrogenophilus]|uniref:tRNA-2-methylthio-N(6)-dimethylallyladenosine synthase n=1 Tax=Desulfobacter hydrogenophilus TaxID=2291 RepID=A0A328FES0_9BACT|nr:tRNA (N6-isopentenyl adenosine(37)-C2)-methylthiotransferase MiaB [Desulfobacter hydrogenophilus]NDY72483.1 tRNA (N6-isopentenyl adenosine(37)-C2)-methylthiotransferase MiaB [Desulfobacter hydrogenophilus]QBH14186.1 tRNA (N6-isopentenyl adenosine(37)-C2)-methylthiotransferase MiaB [Desulfobacter hydrogenophilus]RAM01527.1 tRNA (N6-isopentenyl adenosine(37)-C2)-methylthiotransferase MiaB [Desulfobacter hydrogenophilus]
MSQDKPKAYVKTIGCQMNVYDSQILAGLLRNAGYEQTRDPDLADLVLCNTCAIRHKAQEKAYSFLGRFAGTRIKGKRPLTIMAGCVAQKEKEKAFVRLPHLDLVLGTQAFGRFETHLNTLVSGKTRIVDTEPSENIFEGFSKDALPGKNQVSRFVTIMQGCENFCTYCVVPYVRGKERSRDPFAIVEEIEGLAASGVREITLLGQNVNSYAGNNGQVSFADLLLLVSRVDGIERIRFATSHPKDLSNDLIQAIKNIDKVCNHLHLPVQSGSNDILKRMNRKYDRDTYFTRISALRQACPDIALSTDLIVGFPGETVSDFQQTMDLLESVEFDAVFAFSYSARSFTPAAKFSNQLDEQTKKDRLNALLDFQEKITEKKNNAFVGKKVTVLVEGDSPKPRDGFVKKNKNTRQMFGRSDANKIVHFASDQAAVGDLVTLEIINAYPHSLWGEVCESD